MREIKMIRKDCKNRKFLESRQMYVCYCSYYPESYYNKDDDCKGCTDYCPVETDSKESIEEPKSSGIRIFQLQIEYINGCSEGTYDISDVYASKGFITVEDFYKYIRKLGDIK
jgi:hypothetical protein